VSFWAIVRKSLRQHWLSSLLAITAISLGIALLVSVFSLREQTYRNFMRVGMGVDAILGPKGSPLQVVLNGLYHLEDMPGKVSWNYYKAVASHPLVTQAIPFCVGHSYGGFRVNAIGSKFFSEFEYEDGKRFSFSPAKGGSGRPFSAPMEAVAGAEAAKQLGIRLGDRFNPVCGVNEDDPVHVNDFITFVGIMAPTGTPYDRAIYIPLLSFYGLSGHPDETAKMSQDENYREISGAYLKIKRIRGGVIHPGIQDLKFEINQSKEAQFVVPNEVLPRLFKIIGWVDRVLAAIASMVTVMAAAFLFVSLYNALQQRRRDIALMRSLGAHRSTVFGLVITEALVITFIAALTGIAVGHIIVAIGAHFIKVETGVRLTGLYVSSDEVWILPVGLLLGALTGIVPAVQAYTVNVAKNLSPIA
jgi:putative ABC transport system permease protein